MNNGKQKKLGFYVAFLIALAGIVRGAEQRTLSCSPDSISRVPAPRRKEILDFQQAVKGGLFYKELVRQAGEPATCEMKLDDDETQLSYQFHGRGHLQATANAGLESTTQRIEIDGFTEKKAIGLLKEVEKNSFSPDGCGIQWDHPDKKTPDDQPGLRAVSYWGDTCNCRASVIYKGNAIVALGMNSAC